ncbi:MAG: hypothetical protein JO368_03485 [Acidimicrobiales bacterium]|nr:hypothetical protein [Acidimicrobiales bacterium]
MFRRLFTRRGAAVIATAGLGVAALSVVAAGPAGADNVTTVISGSGSNTIYQLDVTLADQFNLAPGCDLAKGSGAQQYDFSCNAAYTGTGAGENGEPETHENPNNDVVFNYPAVGSGTGVQQLLGDVGGDGNGPPDINFARSSATPANSHGTAAQNYVQFAIDGVSWVAFPDKTNGRGKGAGATLTVAQLENIYKGNATGTGCVVKGTTYPADNWICYGAKHSDPIDCYVAQTGSGTEKTWAALITGGSDTPGCLNNETVGTSASHAGLFENEISAIFDPTSQWHNADATNAIFYFSTGKFAVECSVKGKSNTCPGQGAGTTTYLGQVDGVTASQASVQPTKCVANDGVASDFQIVRCLSNVYNNSTSGGAPGTAAAPATQTTLNFASEYGYLCKQQTKTDVNPYTGDNYRFDIETAIIQNGFYPIDPGYVASSGTAGNPFSEEPTLLAHPASITDPNYQTVDPDFGVADPTGYCLPING